MNFREKDKSYNHTIMIKRAIEVDSSLREWIFTNSNYRRKVWNDFVAEYYRCRDNGEVFDAMKYKSWYFHNIEEPNHEYDTHVVGISEQVMKDVICGLKVVKGNNGKLRFHKFDRFRCGFGVHCKPCYVPLKNELPDRFNSRVYFTDDQIAFRSGFGDTRYIKLKEPLFHDTIEVDGNWYFFDKNRYYAFSQEDVKQISFIHELGKFYVCLAVNVINTYSRKYEIHKRKDSAGIDLGIHNPVCISDEDSNYISRMEDRELKRLHYLERRARRLQSIMDRKQFMSKNYIKVLRKFRITWYRIVNLRKNWRRKLSKRIALAYKKICVDIYEIPKEKDHEPGLTRKVIRKINAFNRLHGMYLFSETLKHTCWKYHTKYIDSPKNTTRTCSKCGCINSHLPLSQRIFCCEECGYTTDRDINAAQNCYAFMV